MTLIGQIQLLITTTKDEKIKSLCEDFLHKFDSGELKASEIKTDLLSILSNSEDYASQKMLHTLRMIDLKENLLFLISSAKEKIQNPSISDAYDIAKELANESSEIKESLTSLENSYLKELSALILLEKVRSNAHIIEKSIYENVIDSLESYISIGFTESDLIEISDKIASKVYEARNISTKLSAKLVGEEKANKSLLESFTLTNLVSPVYSENANEFIIFDSGKYFKVNENSVKSLSQPEVLALPNRWRQFTAIFGSVNTKIYEDRIIYNRNRNFGTDVIELLLNGEIFINGILTEAKDVRRSLGAHLLENDTELHKAMLLIEHRNFIYNFTEIKKLTTSLSSEVDMLIVNLNESFSIVKNSISSSVVYPNSNERVLSELLKNFYGFSINESDVSSFLNASNINEELFESISLKNYEKNSLTIKKIVSPAIVNENSTIVFVKGTSYEITNTSVNKTNISESFKTLCNTFQLPNVKIEGSDIVYYIDKNKVNSRVVINESGISINNKIIDASNLDLVIQEGSWSIKEDSTNIKTIANNINSIVELDTTWELGIKESVDHSWIVFKVGDSYFVDKNGSMKTYSPSELSESIKSIFNVDLSASVNESLQFVSTPILNKKPGFIESEARKQLISGKLGLVESITRFKKKPWFSNPQVYYLANSIETGKFINEISILESWLNVLKHYEFDMDVKEDIKYYDKLKTSFTKEFAVLETINDILTGSQADFFSDWTNLVKEALTNDETLESILKINSKWEFNKSIKSLSEKLLNIKGTTFNIKSVNESIAVENVVSPVAFSKDDANITYFYNAPNFYKFDKSTSEIEKIGEDFAKDISIEWYNLCLLLASDSFTISDDQIGMFLDDNKISFDLKSNKVKANDEVIYPTELENGEESEELSSEEEEQYLGEALIKSGLFKYEKLNLIPALCKLYENRENIVEIDFVKNFKNKLRNNSSISIFTINEKLYINTYSLMEKLNKFEPTTASYLRSHVNKMFGVDISRSLISYLQKENTEITSLNESKNFTILKISKYQAQYNKIENAISNDILLYDSIELLEAKQLLISEIEKLKVNVKIYDQKIIRIFENSIFAIGDKVKIVSTGLLGSITGKDENTGKFIVIDSSSKSNTYSLSELEDLEMELANNIEKNTADYISPEESIDTFKVILVSDVDEVPTGTEVSILPEDYTKIGDDDNIDFTFNGKIYNTIKRNLAIVNSEVKKVIEDSVKE